ncbi:hypothetical protein P154DRAFT_582851 [Amniculicola lignicola CBS 123094]|uniref:Uncharacterized protein n=1 Tax=Amniculicola lignicola CBS 123094 TaxID=1392246 RepID=A0A6A5W6X9_9PLEO|nr:hypothetical protein P154DRAFT_582851 [Amniculicola lignicola CBS 123094]
MALQGVELLGEKPPGIAASGSIGYRQMQYCNQRLRASAGSQPSRWLFFGLAADTKAPSPHSPRSFFTRHPSTLRRPSLLTLLVAPPRRPSSPLALAALAHGSQTVFDMQPQSSTSRRQAKKRETKDRRRQAKEQFMEMQRQIRHRLPFQVHAEPRVYLAESKFGPKQAPRLKKAAQQRSRTGQ